MRLSTSKRLRNAMGGGVALGGLAIAMSLTTYVLRIDPFRTLRGGNPDPVVGVALDDVDLRHYESGKLVTQAKIERVTLRRDRQQLTMTGIHDGVYYGRDGKFQYSADRADWTAASQSINVIAGAHVTNADLDLRTNSFLFDIANSHLTVPGAVSGRIQDGQIVGDNVEYSLATRAFSVNVVSWEGNPHIGQIGQDDSERKKWRTLVPCRVSSKDGITVYINAELTDGDVIVKAPRIERVDKTDVFTATGEVLYFSAKANLRCSKAVIYNEEKRAVLTGEVRMLIRAKENEKLAVEDIPPYRPVVPDEVSKGRPPAPNVSDDEQKKFDDELHTGKSIRKYPVLVYAEKIEYWYRKGERHAIITGNPQAHQELTGGRWRQVWTHEALYDGEAETLKLVSTQGKSDTRVKTSLDDDGTCTWAVLSTKEDDDSYEADGMMFTASVARSDVPEGPKNNTTGGGGGTTTGGGGGTGKTTGGGRG